MTNYNERLDKILSIFSGGITARGSDKGGYPTYFTEPYPIWCEARKTRAKQLITSLIKELVAEAKPPVIDTQRRSKRYANDEGQMWYDRGQNDTIARFEQNLLKALEEV